jgi:hypothetical protein
MHYVPVRWPPRVRTGDNPRAGAALLPLACDLDHERSPRQTSRPGVPGRTDPIEPHRTKGRGSGGSNRSVDLGAGVFLASRLFGPQQPPLIDGPTPEAAARVRRSEAPPRKPAKDAEPPLWRGWMNEAKRDTPIRSPRTGLRGAFWMKVRRWARIGSGRTCPTPRIVPIKAIWRGSIRKPQVHLLPPAKPDMPSRVMARRRAR